MSHFRPAYDFTRISILNTLLCLGALVYGLPRRWWRSALYGPWFLLSWIMGLIVAFVCLIVRVKPQTYRRIFHYEASLLMHTLPGSPFKVIYKQGALDKKQAAIYVANHTSLFDILMIVAIHPNLTILTKGWVFSNPFFAATARMAGFASISQGFDSITSIVQNEVNKGTSVLVFPEGSRSAYGVLQRFHRGAVELADECNIPIQPVIINGAFRLMSKGEVYIGKTQMSATLMPAIMPDNNFLGEDTRKRNKNLHSYYKQLLTAY